MNYPETHKKTKATYSLGDQGKASSFVEQQLQGDALDSIGSQIAKINPPDVQSVLKRERVFSILAHACGKPIVWVSAPAGSGKTILVASFLKALHIPCVWYRMVAHGSLAHKMARAAYYIMRDNVPYNPQKMFS